MDEVDINFLPLVHDILKSFEREPYSGELVKKIEELQAKLQRAREQIDKVNGIELSKEEQERQIELLRQQLVTKTELLKKYKNLCNFDISRH